MKIIKEEKASRPSPLQAEAPAAILKVAKRIWPHITMVPIVSKGATGSSFNSHFNLYAQVTLTNASSARYHSCAIVSGALQCWGRNESGQHGDGSGVEQSLPVTVIIN